MWAPTCLPRARYGWSESRRHRERNSIGDYALLSDRHSAALVSRDGSIDWLCMPRFDSSSVFARLLGDDAGHWSIRAAGATEVSRRYLNRTMVIETTFRTATGVLTVVDALAMGEGNRGHELGNDSPHLLLRRATCTAGKVEVEVEYSPRPEYGLIYPLLSAVEGGVTAVGGADILVLSCPTPMDIADSSAHAHSTLSDGQSLEFALHHGMRAERRVARVWSQVEIAGRLEDTISAWDSWSELHQSYEGPWRDLVHQSGRVLQALSFQPTGAICAAATTSLPEWKRVQDEIHDAIVTNGWSDTAKAFTQSFGSDELDASNLMMALVGFLPADDPRILATIDATEERLTDERGLVYRYRSHDGLDCEEGTFLLCTFWLAHAMALSDQPERARASFSNGPSPSSTTSGCWPKRSTPRPASCSATSRRRSAISVW